ncbi:sugar permease [uncultured Limosilactobacillus sp.]|uniref:sugar permease n=1 Tax=uncultured Limosilactobacillus sp. TaxID=2837629 RepID=UPI0025DC1D4B|nr:sugar permease [uncultured Limosilactobacillus sp.]
MRRGLTVALAIILNAFGQSLTIVTNMGSMPWPASIVNMMHALHWTMTATIFTEGLVVIVLNAAISGWLNWGGLGKEFAFLIPYSFLMQWFADGWRFFGVDRLAIGWRLVCDLAGLLVAFAGVASYQQANCCHPQDDLSMTLKRHFSVRFTMGFNLLLPVIIIIVCVLHNQTLYAVHVGTVIGLLAQRRVVTFYDEYLPALCRC